MARYHASIHSPADVESAFAYLSRFDRAAEWDPGVASGAMLTPEPVSVGTRFRLVTRFAGRSLPLEYEVLELVPPRRIVLRADTPMLRSVDTITFTTVADGTLVDYDARLEGKGVVRFADPVLAPVFRRIGDRAATGLRAHLQNVPKS